MAALIINFVTDVVVLVPFQLYALHLSEPLLALPCLGFSQKCHWILAPVPPAADVAGRVAEIWETLRLCGNTLGL